MIGPGRHAGLDPASRFFSYGAEEEAGPRLKAGVTGEGQGGEVHLNIINSAPAARGT